MFRRVATAAALAVTLATGIAAPAEARHWGGDGYGYERGYGGGYGYGGDGYDRRRGYGGGYGGYRGRRCRDRGDGGLAIGAIAGGLLGNVVAGRGDRLLGTVIGAGVGGLAGRAIDRSDGRPC